MAQPDQRPSPIQPEAAEPDDVDDDEILDLLRRERADFLNFRRRVELERHEDRDRAKEEVLQRFLPLLDELDRAVRFIPGGLVTDPWVQGVGLIREKLASAYQDLGVRRVGTEGEPFDPLRHEAVSYSAQRGVTEPTVSEVFSSGYERGDRLLRPAQVAVTGASGPPTSSDEGAGGRDERQPDADAGTERAGG